MRGERPSTTAALVASARSAAGVDPFATRLVPRPFVWLARHGVLDVSPLVAMMRLRTRAIDEATLGAVRRGVGQIVILGAGLDARAWRLAELERATVYEVDHPATQRYKRARLAGLRAEAREVRFVGVDFEKDDLGDSLERAGHEATKPTCWIWEGVTPYLTPPAIASTLQAIRARSAEGSVLALSYFAPNRRGLALRSLEVALFAMGEPFRGMLSTEEMARMLDASGFVVRDDASYPDLARRLELPRPRTSVAASERVLVATTR